MKAKSITVVESVYDNIKDGVCRQVRHGFSKNKKYEKYFIEKDGAKIGNPEIKEITLKRGFSTPDQQMIKKVDCINLIEIDGKKIIEINFL